MKSNEQHLKKVYEKNQNCQIKRSFCHVTINIDDWEFHGISKFHLENKDPV